MSKYAAEPVPQGVEAVTASYLDRQFNQIQTAFMSDFVAPKLGRVPQRSIPGSIVYIEDDTDPSQNGFYGCVKNSQGEGEWKKLTLS
jgi:hypothetical protein